MSGSDLGIPGSSVIKPTELSSLFPSLRYQLLLNTYVTLGAQRTSALKDLDTLENLRASASARPYKFIKQVDINQLGT